ncbi:hypothetical protein Glove_87g123 [Diversispora epigaea]|uniref:Uncharacterized protein n=1 Tax=Diversispora epigaea TaxID=1348612 RepID=A0A397J9T6_9GLOM|nr:hypothetical protein Glove_87g123 [Diversispora epigaea]
MATNMNLNLKTTVDADNYSYSSCQPRLVYFIEDDGCEPILQYSSSSTTMTVSPSVSSTSTSTKNTTTSTTTIAKNITSRRSTIIADTTDATTSAITSTTDATTSASTSTKNLTNNWNNDYLNIKNYFNNNTNRSSSHYTINRFWTSCNSKATNANTLIINTAVIVVVNAAVNAATVNTTNILQKSNNTTTINDNNKNSSPQIYIKIQFLKETRERGMYRNDRKACDVKKSKVGKCSNAIEGRIRLDLKKSLQIKFISYIAADDVWPILLLMMFDEYQNKERAIEVNIIKLIEKFTSVLKIKELKYELEVKAVSVDKLVKNVDKSSSSLDYRRRRYYYPHHPLIHVEAVLVFSWELRVPTTYRKAY